MYRSHFRSVLWFWETVLASLVIVGFLLLAGPSAVADSTPLTQQKINEITAGLLSGHLELQGIQVVRSASESQTVYGKRLLSYGAILDRAVLSLAPLRETVVLRTETHENVGRWKRLEGAARRLPAEAAAYKALVKKGGSPPAIQSALTTARKTIWNVYSELRDARP